MPRLHLELHPTPERTPRRPTLGLRQVPLDRARRALSNRPSISPGGGLGVSLGVREGLHVKSGPAVAQRSVAAGSGSGVNMYMRML